MFLVQSCTGKKKILLKIVFGQIKGNGKNKRWLNIVNKRTIAGGNTEDTCHLEDGNFGLFFPEKLSFSCLKQNVL